MKGCSDRVMQALWGSQGGPIKVAVYVALVDLLCLLNLGLNTPLFRQPTSADTLAIVFLAIFVSSSILLLAKVLQPKLWTIPGLWAVIFAAALVSHQELNIYLVGFFEKDCLLDKKWESIFKFYIEKRQILNSILVKFIFGTTDIFAQRKGLYCNLCVAFIFLRDISLEKFSEFWISTMCALLKTAMIVLA